VPRHPKDSPPPRDPQQNLDDLRREHERLRDDMRRSEIERNRLRRENERLKEEREMARLQTSDALGAAAGRRPRRHLQ